MVNFNFLHLSYQHLHWRRPSGPPLPPPEGTTRTFIPTSGGEIELLRAGPSSAEASATDEKSSLPVVVFLHGGMGSAWVWHEYMRYLAARGVTSYAVSARGHGASWHPSFLRMLYATTKRDLASDFAAGVRAAREIEGEGRQIVVVGHSSGGGLAQFMLAEGMVKVNGLALLGAVPGTGSIPVYINWWRLDPWFTIRMLFHGWHSNSPLSHPFLIRQAFFSRTYPDDKLAEFTARSNRYESFLWPLGMMFRFAEPADVLSRGIEGWGRRAGNTRLLIMAGTEEKLMTRPVQEKITEVYRTAFSGLVREEGLDVADDDEAVHPSERNDGDNIGHGVELAWVPGAGHHLQNDTMWEIGAKKLLGFLRRLDLKTPH